MKDHNVSARLTEDQFNLARHRMFVEQLGWQDLLSAAVNAYILGDLSVTPQGRYSVKPPQGERAIVEVPREIGTIEVEPDWGVKDGRPDVDPGKVIQNQRSRGWGTRELAAHLRKITDRAIGVRHVRRLLNVLEIPKEGGSYWYFKGPHDQYVKRVEEAVADGTYDILLHEGMSELNKLKEEREQLKNKKEQAEEDRRKLMAEKLKRIQSD